MNAENLSKNSTTKNLDCCPVLENEKIVKITEYVFNGNIAYLEKEISNNRTELGTTIFEEFNGGTYLFLSKEGREDIKVYFDFSGSKEGKFYLLSGDKKEEIIPNSTLYEHIKNLPTFNLQKIKPTVLVDHTLEKLDAVLKK